MIIFAGIVSRFLPDILKIIGAVQEQIMDPFKAIAVLVIAMVVTACIVFLEKGERKFLFNIHVVLLDSACMQAKVHIFHLKLILQV